MHCASALKISINTYRERERENTCMNNNYYVYVGYITSYVQYTDRRVSSKCAISAKNTRVNISRTPFICVTCANLEIVEYRDPSSKNADSFLDAPSMP